MIPDAFDQVARDLILGQLTHDDLTGEERNVLTELQVIRGELTVTTIGRQASIKLHLVEVEDIENIALDFAESQLHKQIGDGNSTATIFFLKTKGRGRGYVERQEIHNTGDNLFNIQILGEGTENE